MVTAEMFSHRLAQIDDLTALNALMVRAIDQLQTGFLSPDQVHASHEVMGLDTQLVRDQTYFVVECDGQIVGCGGWSWRATLFGGDHSIVAREPAPLDPQVDAAKIRAMYVDPHHVRRGIGTLIIDLCEHAAQQAGFQAVEMMATLAGIPLYARRGYVAVEEAPATTRSGIVIPMVRMQKHL